MQPGIVAAGERILSFISSFHCFFRQKKIFFLKKAAINTYMLNWNPSFQFASLSSDLANRLHK